MLESSRVLSNPPQPGKAFVQKSKTARQNWDELEQRNMPKLYRYVETRSEGDTLILEIQVEEVREYMVAEELRYELVHAVKKSECQRFVLDLSKMTFMTSLACVAFIGVKHAVRDVGGRLVLCNMSPFIRKILDAKRLLSPSQQTGNAAFESADDLTAALAVLAN